MRVLGMDYGAKKIGLAFGDTDLLIAGPMEVLVQEGDEKLINRLNVLIEGEKIETIVVGIPRKRSGEDTQQAQRHRNVIELLRKSLRIPIVAVDESFTSKESQRLLGEMGSRASEDALAAMLILQEYFETL